MGLVGKAKFVDFGKSEEPQLSETLLAVKEILTWDLTFATFFWCLEYFICCFNATMAILPNLRDEPPQSLQEKEFSSFPFEVQLLKSGYFCGSSDFGL